MDGEVHLQRRGADQQHVARHRQPACHHQPGRLRQRVEVGQAGAAQRVASRQHDRAATPRQRRHQHAQAVEPCRRIAAEPAEPRAHQLQRGVCEIGAAHAGSG